MKLRVPTVLAFTMLAGTGAIAVVTASAISCSGGSSPDDAAVAGDEEPPAMVCDAFCIPDENSDAGTCPTDPIVCAGPADECPAGCRPVG